MDLDLNTFSANRSDVAEAYASQDDRPKGKPTKPKADRSFDLPRHRDGERFIRGPIPLEWMKLASKCGNRAEAVAVLLWYAAGFQRSNPVKLSTKILTELGVHPRTAKRVLIRMEVLGLTKNEFKRGRSPVVLIKAAPSLQL